MFSLFPFSLVPKLYALGMWRLDQPKYFLSSPLFLQRPFCTLLSCPLRRTLLSLSRPHSLYSVSACWAAELKSLSLVVLLTRNQALLKGLKIRVDEGVKYNQSVKNRVFLYNWQNLFSYSPPPTPKSLATLKYLSAVKMSSTSKLVVVHLD